MIEELSKQTAIHYISRYGFEFPETEDEPDQRRPCELYILQQASSRREMGVKSQLMATRASKEFYNNVKMPVLTQGKRTQLKWLLTKYGGGVLK